MIIENMGIESTPSGFPVARSLTLTTPGNVLVINLATEDGRLIRQEITTEQLARIVVQAIPYVVRV